MGIFTSETLDSFEDLFKDQLQDIYDAEHRITEALPTMADAADSADLAGAFREHLQESERQIERLERVFELLNEKPRRRTCDAMKGLIAEGEAIANAKGSADVRDAGLIAAAQRVEHYEMAGYGCLRSFAHRLNLGEAVELLQASLDEEGAADKKLTAIAEASINAETAL